MYLKNIIIENNWPIERFELLESKIFNEEWKPKTIILAWKNWTWKSILLSQIFDSICNFHSDIFTDKSEKTLKWVYDNSENDNIDIDKIYGFSYMDFYLWWTKLEYIEKIWNLSFNDCREKTKNLLTLSHWWNNETKIKKISNLIPNEWKNDFLNNSYIFSSINEYKILNWSSINSENEKLLKNIDKNHDNIIQRKLIKISSFESIKAWLFDIIIDWSLWTWIWNESDLLDNINRVLSKIMWKSNVRFWFWNRFQSTSRINILEYETDEQLNEISRWPIIPSIDNLSSWQIILLNLFLNIIKASDKLNYSIEDIEWIVIIDEIEAHLHTDLQRNALPELIAMFPKIQFIITTYSPFFLLWMKNKKEQSLDYNDFVFVKMPDWKIVDWLDLHKIDEIQKSYIIFEWLFE